MTKSNNLKGQLIWPNHLGDIQDQKGCIFGDTLYSVNKNWFLDRDREQENNNHMEENKNVNSNQFDNNFEIIR